MRIITGDTARDVFKAYTCFIHVSFLFDVLLKRKVSCELIIPVTFLLSSPFCPDSFWHLYSSSQFFISLTVILTSLSSHSRTSYPLWQPSSQLCHLTEMTQVVIDSEDELHIHTCTTEVKKKKGGVLAALSSNIKVKATACGYLVLWGRGLSFTFFIYLVFALCPCHIPSSPPRAL